jgi:type I restriction enzyme S subunit
MTSLGSVCSQITDGTHKTPNYVSQGVPFISVKDFSGGHLDFSATRFVAAAEHAQLIRRCRPERGDVLLGRIGTLGKPVVVNDDREFSLFVSVGLLKPRRSLIASEYLRLFLDSSLAHREFDRIKVGAGTHTNKLNLGDLKTIAVPLPPLPEQERIIAKVDELMALCDHMEATQKERESRRDALRRASLQRLTAAEAGGSRSLDDVRFFLHQSRRLITKPEHVAAMRRSILDLAVQGQLVPRDPRNCLRTTLGKIGTWGSGGTPNTGNREFYDGTIPWVVIGDLNEGTVVNTAQTITKAGLANSSAKLIEPGTILIAMYGASVGKLGIAGVKCATNQAIAHCVPDLTLIGRDYLFLLLRSLRSSLVASAKGGAQPNISQTMLKGWNIALPPLNDQNRIVAKVGELMAVCDELEAALASVQTGRGRLLEALLQEALNKGTGQVATAKALASAT